MNFYKLYQGDCLDVMSNFKDNEFNLCLTDPPYNVDLGYDIHEDNLSYEKYKTWCSSWFTELKRISDFILITPGRSNIKMWYEIDEPRDMLLWVINNGMTRNHLYGFLCWEPILAYGIPTNKKQGKKELYEASLTNQKSVGTHPCPKPLKLFTSLVKTFTNEGDKVLDCFMGSGTTMYSCQDLRRNCVGIELSEQYCDIIKQRCFHRRFLDRDVEYDFIQKRRVLTDES